CQEIGEIRNQITFKLDNNRFIIKDGIRSSVQYLIRLCRKKFDEHLKQLNPKGSRSSVVQQISPSTPSPPTTNNTTSTNTTALVPTQRSLSPRTNSVNKS
ncbi:unnamed protein product, partial [Didymodactylos carnosus]